MLSIIHQFEALVALRYERLGFIIQSLLQAAWSFLASSSNPGIGNAISAGIDGWDGAWGA